MRAGEYDPKPSSAVVALPDVWGPELHSYSAFVSMINDQCTGRCIPWYFQPIKHPDRFIATNAGCSPETDLFTSHLNLHEDILGC